jgi:hypothetical protein
MSELSTSEARKLMEVYTSMCAPQQENLSEEVEKIDEKMDVFSAIRNTPSPVFTGQKPPKQQPNYLQTAANAGATKFFTKPGAQTDKSWEAARQKSGVSKPAAPARPASPGAPARPAAPAAAKPAPSSVVLAKKGGVEGKLDKATGKFTAGAFTGAEKARYTARGGSAAPSAPKPPATGTLGSTSFERRTPTSTELKAAQAARASGAGPEKALQSAKMAGAGASAASKPLTNQTKTAFSSSTPALAKPLSTAPEIKQTADIAKKTTQPPVAPGYQGAKKPFGEGMDAYDVVLEYLLANGHVDSVDEAHYVMLEMGSETIQDIVEARKSYSAKAARAGKDIGLPGKGFEKIATEAGKRYGSKERGEKVAGAVLAGLRKKHG